MQSFYERKIIRAALIMIYHRCVLFVILDRDPCELLCKVKRSLRPKGDVMDGTRCSLDRSIKDVCIEGKCRVCKSPPSGILCRCFTS